MNLSTIITKNAENTPNKVALENEVNLITYQKLENTINQTANAFLQLGIKKGDRILIQIGNQLEFVYCYFGAIRCGAIIVPINPAYTATEVSHIANDCQPALYICEEAANENIPVVKKLSKNLIDVFSIDSEEINFLRLIKEKSEINPEINTDGDDVCEILYTSGTTGKPKGVMLTHNSLYINASTYRDVFQATKDDYCLIPTPLYHSASQTNCMNTIFIAGGTNFIIPKYSTKKVMKLLDERRITYFFGPPSILALLLNHEDVHKINLDLHVTFTGSAPMPVELLKQWKEIFGFELVEGYGLTECSPVVCTHRPEDVKKPGSIGRELPGVQVKVVDEKGNEVPVGERGELIVKGPNVMKGYWNNPEATANTIKDNWLYTGDIAIKDEDGYYYIVDRKKDMIIRGGLNVYPREVEEVLYAHPNILEASAIGVPDQVMGEEIKVFYSLKNKDVKVTEDELKEFCKKRLAPYKVPRFYEELDSLPRTVSGKILKQNLKKLIHSEK